MNEPTLENEKLAGLIVIFERVLDPNHPKVITCRENFARLKRS